MTIITPTIGRKVWFRPNGTSECMGARFDVMDFGQPFDATVVCVYGDRMVNLVVRDHGGVDHRIRSVTLVQEGDKPPAGWYCEWMPYQKAQAEAAPAAKSATYPADVSPAGTHTFDFGGAITRMENGFNVARKGWNGKGMWIQLVTDWNGVLGNMPARHKLLPWFGMKTADGSFVPWLASQTDMLAKDWVLVETVTQ